METSIYQWEVSSWHLPSTPGFGPAPSLNQQRYGCRGFFASRRNLKGTPEKFYGFLWPMVEKMNFLDWAKHLGEFLIPGESHMIESSKI